jgi:DNA (cytosine-5)-methyltransferase 1
MKKIKIGSDFSGVGAFDYAIKRIAEKKNLYLETIFSCDWDKYARITYAHNHGEPKYFPKDVYEREIPTESLDIYMTSPPCQSFSLAGKRKGKNDPKGILFFNSHEFIKKNKPRYFIFENVKGLLSDDNGNTFNEWVNMLGGKSVNGNPIIFAYEDSVPYHLYFKVLNSKEHGVPQNRERIFLVGIRDNQDNIFQFPKEEPLKIKLKDILEKEVDEKYFLSEKIQNQFVLNNKQGSVIGTTKPEFRTIGERDNVHNPESYMSCLTATDCKQPKQILVKSNTKKGFDIATENDSINFSVPSSETRRGRVGIGVAQTLDTQCNQDVIVNINQSNVVGSLSGGKWDKIHESARRVYNIETYSPTIHTMQGGNLEPKILNDFKVRKLTPRECFRLQDFSDTFDFSCVSDSQAYKQAGNSITVRVLEKILDKLKL